MQIQNIQIPTNTPETQNCRGASSTARGNNESEGFSELLGKLMGNMENIQGAELVEVLENVEVDIEEVEMELPYPLALPFNLMNFQNQDQQASVEVNLSLASESQEAQAEILESIPAQTINLLEEGQAEGLRNLIPKEVTSPKEEAKLSFEKELQIEGKKLEGEKIEKIPLEVKPKLDDQAEKMELPKEAISKEEKSETFKAEMFNLQAETKETQNTEPKTETKQLEPALVKENIQRLNDSIIKLIETTTIDNKSVMKVKLYPEELGTLDLTLEMQEGKLVAKILVDNENVKQLFSDKLGELNQNLIKQNISIEDFKVEVKPEASLDFNFQGEFNQEDRQNPRTNRRYGHKEIMPEETPMEVTNTLRTSGELSILA